MLAKRVIPCLDVKDGRVVKGVSFVELRDAGDPVELAASYDKQGADELVFLDITASAENRSTIVDVARRTAAQVFIPFTIGGGINDLETIRLLLSSGADKVSINTAAVKNPEFVRQASRKFGAQCIVVAVDAKRNATGRWEIFTHGGRQATGLDALEWVKKMEDYGAGEILLTSMDADGHKDGYDLPLTQAVAQAVSIPVIASGGAGHREHIRQVLTEGLADAALAASIFHYKETTIDKVKEYLEGEGVCVRR